MITERTVESKDIPLRITTLFRAGLLAALTSIAAAQDTIPTAITPTNTTGDQPYSTQVGTATEHVEMANGNLIVTIPFLNVPGRRLSFDYGLRYDAALWIMSQAAGGNQWSPEQRPWLTSTTIGWTNTQPYLTQSTGTMLCTGAQGIDGPIGTNPVQPSGSRADNPLYTDSHGVKHAMQVNFQNNAPCDAGTYIIQNN